MTSSVFAQNPIVTKFISAVSGAKGVDAFALKTHSNPEVLINTSFEGTTDLEVKNNGRDHLIGQDNTVFPYGRWDWESLLNDPNELSYQNGILYEVPGNKYDRGARILSLQNGKNAMEFYARRAVIDQPGNYRKARVQLDVTFPDGPKHFRQKFKMFVPPSMSKLKNFPCRLFNNQQWGHFNWLTISEFWNNKPDEDYPYRITINIVKESPQNGSNLFFKVTAGKLRLEDNKWENFWEETNVSFPVVFGDWMDIEYEVTEGNASTGRFKMWASGGKFTQRTLLFNKVGFTRHPDDPSPDGFRSLNPIKLYSHHKVVNWVERDNCDSNGDQLDPAIPVKKDPNFRILYDDLRIDDLGMPNQAAIKIK
jgi:hypothetical protein